MPLCDDLKTLEDDIEARLHAVIGRASDLEQLTRLTAGLVVAAQRQAAYNARLLQRICEALRLDISDIPPPKSLSDPQRLSASKSSV